MSESSNSLLLSEEAWALPTELYSCLHVRGLYSPLQFVLRLRPDIHRALNTAPAGPIMRNQLSGEQLNAFSTYLHETIHWWQHVGSTTGLFLSLLYPAQSHINHRHLKEILSELGPIKSIRNYNLQHARPAEHENGLDKTINAALNNWHDIEFYRWLVIDPKNCEELVRDRYFECVGHSYELAIGSILWLLSATIDPDQEIFPDPRTWESEINQLRAQKIEGFYYGSPVNLLPLGAKEIFEGQARFSQLQYLYLSSDRTISWDDFDKAGMLDGVYIAAFNHFIELTKLKQPSELDDPTIGLFLLVCDISINPAEGFVKSFADFESLVETHDPGWRFIQLCLAIKEMPSLPPVINYSTEEYWSISEQLCSETSLTSPSELTKRVIAWPKQHQKIAELLEEDETFNFSLGNLPVRVFLARFIRLQIDKSTTPEFFCWPGVWMTTAKEQGITPEVALSLFEEHRALFIDKEDGDVYPRTFTDRDEKTVLETFNTFYSWVVSYELTRQWLVGDGDFDCSFSWLTSKYPRNEIEAWASGIFEEAFGIPTNRFKII